MLHIRAEVLHDYVSVFDQPQQHRVPVRMLEVQCQAALVGMDVLEIEPVPFARAIILGRIGRFDFDHLRAHLAQLADRSWPRSSAGQIDNFDVGEWANGLRHRS